MLGTMQPEVLASFYEKIFGKAPDMQDGNWSGWQVGASFFSVGEHSEMGGMAKDPGRLMFVLQADDVKGEYQRMVDLGATSVKEPYEMGGMWIATLADPDGNYFQLMTKWEDEQA